MKNSSYLARHCVILSLFRAPGVPPGFLSCGRSSFAGVVRPLFLLVPVKKNLTLSPAPICSRGFDSAKIRAGLADGLRVAIPQRFKRPPARLSMFSRSRLLSLCPGLFSPFSEKSVRAGNTYPVQQGRLFKHAMHPGRIPRGRFAFVGNFLPVNGRPLPGLASWASWVPRAGFPVWIRGPWSLVPVKEKPLALSPGPPLPDLLQVAELSGVVCCRPGLPIFPGSSGYCSFTYWIYCAHSAAFTG